MADTSLRNNNYNSTDRTFHFQGEPGRRTCILSIDGGGVRGVIPAAILEFLENQLQKLDGPDARIASYFDVVAGTSTGGIIATMLSSPDASRKPLYSAKDITSFYMNFAKSVFPQQSGIIGSTEEVLKVLTGPKYSPKNLEDILANQLHDLKLSNAITELLVPSFDIKLMQPVFFSTSEAKEDHLKDAYLRDVCRGTSAAPIYFPPHFFQTQDSSNNHKDYNLVDGALAENNPTYLSIIHVLKEMYKGNDQFCKHMKNRDYQNFLVLSLGTGTRSISYEAKEVSHWGALSWIFKDGQVPLVDMCLNGSADMVDFNLSVVFQTLECRDNYLRIQVASLPEDVSKLDNSTNQNMQKLYEIGTNILDNQVTNVDVSTGQYIPQPSQGTNKQALARLARELVKEKRMRNNAIHS